MAQEDNRTKIVAAALKMFNSNGYRATTMDDIAAALHISKRTLYETFNNKEDLFEACLDMAHRSIGEIHQKIFAEIDEPLLAILYIAKANTMSNLDYNRLIQDAERYLPQLHDRHFNILTDHFRHKVEQILHEAQQRKVLREDAEVDTAVDFICNLVQQCRLSEIDDKDAYMHRTNEIVFTYMRGMLNTATIKRYEDHEAEYGSTLKKLQKKQTSIN